MQFISRNGRYALDTVLNAAQSSLLLCVPFITAVEMDKLIGILRRKPRGNQLAIRLITDIRPDSILAGALDVHAIIKLLDVGLAVSITALAGVHAKVYVADRSTAWVTSANLTTSALDRNFEYGVLFDEPEATATIYDDIIGYSRLGAQATHQQLVSYATAIESLRQEYQANRRAAERSIKLQFDERLEHLTVEAMRLQIGNRAPHAIFAEAIVYLLRSGPMSTKALHPQIQRLLPDLCDDLRERVIDGRHYGKLWKHHVRGAQQHLKRVGAVVLENGVWRLQA
jgi:hypothetical protein